MSRQPFNWYVEQYNMVGKNRHKADYRFSKRSWESLMTYREYEVEDAVKAALKLPKLELVKQMRHEPLLCTYHQENGWIGGAAMRAWECPGCKRHLMNGSTAIPAFCSSCAFDKFVCSYCGKSLDETNS